MDSKTVIKKLKDNGWVEVSQKGSHVTLKHPTIQNLVTVPHPTKDLTPGVLSQIKRKSGLSFP